jgi:5-dehydro-2-deoxygluconokinase
LHRTSAVILTIQPPDRFPLTYYREGCADRELTCDDVRGAPVGESAILVVSGTGLTHEPSRSATLFAADGARAAGRDVFLDLDYRPDQWSSRAIYAGVVQRLAARSSIVVGTEEEVVAAADDDDVERAVDLLLRAGPETLILKRGAAGASIFTPGSPARPVASFPIEVLNVLGAGDAFASGLIWGLRRGLPLERAVRMGNAVGAIVVTRHGCANFMPTEQEVEAFVAEKGGW